MTRLAKHVERKSAPAGRGSRAGKCNECGAPVRRGPDADVASFMAVVDPAPISTQGEALARLSGRWTYDLRPRGNGWEISRRDRWHMKGRPAGKRTNYRYDVVAEHRCGELLPASETMFPVAEKGNASDTPPF